jgi:hypothetical protein
MNSTLGFKETIKDPFGDHLNKTETNGLELIDF